ncbi:uncharacterized protein LOC111344053 [Stylophora pistillata]|uniref:Interleukin 17-like protein n=1 Tax=Stylophora pistillata TaxID=50429 RepID=A0A2B4RFH1_STYPI|nr:uncharacterized protein LOC111344053 [Stylophora pistillata]PFX15025.1 hypothetical protein AWC38_SpisGene20775 [Stylophora pistillata]
MFSAKFLLLLLLIQITAGFPRMNELKQDPRGHLSPPLELTNETLSSSSDVAKRFLNSRACNEIYSRIDPQKYFQSNDIFIPRSILTVKCEGTPNYPLPCGSTLGSMRCLTRMGDVEVMRIPNLQKCFWRRRVVIKNVPVGCYCEY